MKTFPCWLVAISFAGHVSWAADPGRVTYRRWAVVASPDLQQDGLPDLLTAELSRQGELELVERERLDLAAKELELSACFGSAGTGKRLQLGRWLGADALLLLSIEQREQQKNVKVVISDCLYGARLRVEYLPYSAADVPQLAKRIVSLVSATREQFAGGIRCLIAVSPFVSRDLIHDYDHWQTGYAALVEQALMTVPAVAVLELEEARTVGQELAVTGGEVRERLVPLFVNGEYATSRGTPDADPTVRLTIRVTQGDRSLEVLPPDVLTQAEVVNVLTERLPLKLINMAAAGDSVPLDRSHPHRANWDRQSLILPNLRWGDSPRAQFVVMNGKVYRPGYDWYRIDASRGRAERLNQERLPVRHVYYCYGVSVHYGLVAWTLGDTVHQVVFGGPVDREEELRNEFFYVPDSERARHIAAVRRLRAAGGRVDAIYDVRSRAASSTGVPFRLNDVSTVSWTASAVVRPPAGWSTGCLPAQRVARRCCHAGSAAGPVGAGRVVVDRSQRG